MYKGDLWVPSGNVGIPPITFRQSRQQIWSDLQTSVPTFLAPTLPNSLIVVMITMRNSSTINDGFPVGVGWQQINGVTPGVDLGAIFDNGRLQMYYRSSGVGGQTSMGNFTQNAGTHKITSVTEFANWRGLLVDFNFVTQHAPGTHKVLPAMAAIANQSTAAIAAFTNGSNATGYSPDAGYTSVSDGNCNGFGPNQNTIYRTSLTLGSYTAGSNDGSEGWCGIGGVFQ